MADHLAKTVYYDGLLKPEEADFDLLDELAQCEPYGIGNPGPVFKMAVPQAAGIKRMGKDKNHLSFAIDDLRCVAFSQGDAYDAVAAGDFSLLCKLKYHQFNGTESVQPLVVDVKGSPLKDNKRAWEMVETIKKGSEAQIKDLEIWDLPREAPFFVLTFPVLTDANDLGTTVWTGSNAPLWPLKFSMTPLNPATVCSSSTIYWPPVEP